MSDDFIDEEMESETQISEQLDESMTNNENKSNTQMKVYPKNSFDRFGDDLTELIVSYEDKVRLECVSKQWKNAMVYAFRKQSVIKIDRKHITTKDNLNPLIIEDQELNERRPEGELNNEALISVLKKCPNITDVKIKIRVNGEVLSLIGRYCPNIKSLCYSTEFRNALDFFRINGHKLEELYIVNLKRDMNENNVEGIKPILELCPNVKKIEYSKFLTLLTENKKYLPKLEQILKFELISEYFDEMQIFFDKYRTNDCLSLIGQKCNKLLKLDLDVLYSVPISDRFFDIFKEFKTIKKLKIELNTYKVLSGSVECFKHCKQLIELDIDCREFKKDFFANIASFVPKLQLLRIKTTKQFPDSFIDSFIDSFYSMKNIRKVTVHVFNDYGEEEDNKKYWYFGKCLSEVMSSRMAKKVKPVNCGLITRNYLQTN